MLARLCIQCLPLRQERPLGGGYTQKTYRGADLSLMEHRQLQRLSVRSPVALVWDLIDGGGQVIDLTTGGCRIRHDGFLKNSTYLRLILHPPHEVFPIKVELAIVRWVTEHEVGVEFIRVHAAHKKRLGQWLKVLDLGQGLDRNQSNGVLAAQHN